MIFINCARESLVQVNDKTRIDVSRSFVAGDSITDILITPEIGGDEISVFNNDQDKWYLDWAYATDGIKTITVRATDGTNSVSQNFDITIVTEEADNLWSNDSQIFQIESELKRYIPRGRNSFINIHREAQSRILSYLDRKRIWKDSGDPYEASDLNLSGELEKWSLYEAIYIIYMDQYLNVGDKFSAKMNQYKGLRNYQRDRAVLRIDKNGNGQLDEDDKLQDTKSFRMIIR